MSVWVQNQWFEQDLSLRVDLIEEFGELTKIENLVQSSLTTPFSCNFSPLGTHKDPKL